MALNFRTTVSAVFWTESPDESQAIVDEINQALPEDARDSTLATVEYVAAGPPTRVEDSTSA